MRIYKISTGIGFLDHMLEQLSRHSLIDLTVEAQGDLHIDYHHTTEDTGWAIGAATKSQKAGWEFLKYISSAEAELDEVSVGATTPSRISVGVSDKFLDPTKPPVHAKAFTQAQEYVVRDPVHVKWPEIASRILTPNMDTLWNGSKTAAEVAKAIKTDADVLLAAG